jgi:hypothetical protein
MSIRKYTIGVLAFGVMGFTLSAETLAQEQWPLVGGDYWEVTAIDVKDGGDWKYANWLATEWRKNLEFAKSKGWIKDYRILGNVYARKGEADLYLVRVMEDIPTGPEGDARTKDWVEFQKKSLEQMVGESGNRAEYREVMSDSLLQELTIRK